MLLMRGCCRRERLWAFRSGCKLSNLFECAVAAAGTRSDFHERAEFEVRITAASLCCELRLRQNTGNYDASVALAQKSSHADALQRRAATLKITSKPSH